MDKLVEQHSFFADHHNRFFFLYGKTNDDFCPDSLGIYRLEEILYFHFKELGYQRIVFYNGKKKIYFYDDASKALSQAGGHGAPASGSAPRPRKTSGIVGGPLKKMTLRRRPASGNEAANRSPAGERTHKAGGDATLPLHFGGETDIEVVSFLGGCMQQDSCDTVVVFSDGLDFISRFDQRAVRQMSMNFNEWSYDLRTENRNICLFILPDMDLERMRSLLNTSGFGNLLWSKMFSGENRPSPQMILVGSPRADEVGNLFHHWRLKKRLQTDWSTLPDSVTHITRELCANSGILRDINQKILRHGSLERDALESISGQGKTESAISRLEKMKGLEVVYEKVMRFVYQLEDYETLDEPKAENSRQSTTSVSRLMKSDKKPRRKINLNLALVGNPGTGKTESARLIAEIFKEKGLLELGHIVKTVRKDLVAGYVGHTAINTAQKINDAMGGVLFVDEAYQLAEGGDNDFGKEAIETIMEAMSDHAGEFAVIIAGYPDKIQDLIETNPGLSSRFGETNLIEIPDYTPDILTHIFAQVVAKNGRQLDTALDETLPDFFSSWFDARDPKTYGNARDVINLYQSMDENRSVRVRRSAAPGPSKFTLMEGDVPQPYRQYLKSQRPENLDEVMKSLEALIGLKEVKKTIRSRINSIKMDKLRRVESGVVPGHYCFIGNPGTGKTTVARQMGKMLKLLGVLKQGQLVETNRSDLVASHVGETALKTKEVLERSLDGVLFIDEAYDVVRNASDTFGQEALAELLTFMENHRDRLCVVVAGYPDDMARFMNENAGLPSRFPLKVRFENFNAAEMLAIFKLLAGPKKMILGKGVEKKLRRLFEGWEKTTTRTFGNGRAIRNLLQENIYAKMNDRLASIGDLVEDDPRLFRIEVSDIDEGQSSG
ncbi:MAG: AAA family ATPase [Proteobacteria bacterium]|nr:AAA family ATPase [Pseudomonadota bacterium]